MKIYHTQSGFSLVETLVAITILLLVIIGPMSISSQTAKSTNFTSDQVVANLLAQEGLEIVQKARDDMILAGFNTPADDWAVFTDESGTYRWCYSGLGCSLFIQNDGSVSDEERCQTAVGCFLFFDDTGARSLFTHIDNGNPTPYRRLIRLTPVPTAGGDQIRVVSTVQWRSGESFNLESVSVETYLFNIYDR